MKILRSCPSWGLPAVLPLCDDHASLLRPPSPHVTSFKQPRSPGAGTPTPFRLLSVERLHPSEPPGDTPARDCPLPLPLSFPLTC